MACRGGLWVMVLLLGYAPWYIATAETPSPPAGPVSAQQWRDAAVRDLEAARDLLASQTPIPYDTEHPAYRAWLERGYTSARALAEQAIDAQGHFYAIAYFMHGFGDPHIAADPLTELPEPMWPGFIAASRDGAVVVVHREADDPSLPPVGAQILDCDGRALSTLVEERLHPFVINPRVELDRRRAATRLFVERGIPGAPAPKTCRFQVGGAERTDELRYRTLPLPADSFWTAFEDAFAGAHARWGIEETARGVYWVGIPSFMSGSDASDKLASLLAEITRRAPEMRAGRAIVIDIRGNGGGNSAWADRIAEALFSKAITADAAKLSKQGKTAVDWRASRENVAHWEQTLQVIRKEFGARSTEAREVSRVLSRLRTKVLADPPIWRQGATRPSTGGGLTQRRPQGAGPFAADVYLLSNGSCASSCLNFADTVLMIPGVKLIGSATGADGPYMEVRFVTLPSERVQVTIPQKVRLGSPRAAMEAYAADIPYPGPWDDQSVRQWAISLIRQAERPQ